MISTSWGIPSFKSGPGTTHAFNQYAVNVYTERRKVMETTQGNLKQLRDAVKQRWGALTGKDLDTVDEKLNQLPGLLQARYGYTREQAEKEIALFLDSMKPEGTNPTEVIRETLSDSTPEEEAHVEKKIYKE
jgi:uncharacterized protein YjbJ (UPF0337 family)